MLACKHCAQFVLLMQATKLHKYAIAASFKRNRMAAIKPEVFFLTKVAFLAASLRRLRPSSCRQNPTRPNGDADY